MEQITISKRAVIALAGSLGVSLLTITFLLGRQSVLPSVVAVTPHDSAERSEWRPPSSARDALEISPAVPTLRAPQSPPVVPPPVVPPPVASAAPVIPPIVLAPVAPPSVAVAARSPSPKAAVRENTEAAEIQRYFAVLDNVVPGTSNHDRRGFAKSIVSSGMSGDFSDFDDLSRNLEVAREKLARLNPPASCIAFHEHATELVSSSIEFMKSIRQAMRSPTNAPIQDIEARANDMQRRAYELSDEADALQRTTLR